MGKNNLTGAWGERIAADFLQKKRYILVAANYRSRFGEIDLIVRNKTYLVFVEVKLRKNANFAAASEFVDHYKQDRLKTTAAIYLDENPTNLQPRFDVIEIYAPQGTQTSHPQINYLEGAFE